jgi:hypothetical protein
VRARQRRFLLQARRLYTHSYTTLMVFPTETNRLKNFVSHPIAAKERKEHKKTGYISNRRKRREQRLILYLSSLRCLRCLRCLMFIKCVWLRLAALCSFAAKSSAGLRVNQPERLKRADATSGRRASNARW